MKRILIVMPSMFIGGAERSLLGLLETIDYDRYDVSLFLYRHEGEFLGQIPERVHLLPQMQSYRTFDTPIVSLLRSRQFFFGVSRLLAKAAARIHALLSGERQGVWMSMQYISRFLQPLLPDIPGSYDLAVMYLGVADTLLGKVQAKKKVAWCHTDCDTLGACRAMDLQTYGRLDRIVCVSEACTEKLRHRYPSLGDRVVTVGNILAGQTVRACAMRPQSEIVPGGGPVLLSIGRFCRAKNFDSVPAICRRLVEDGLDVRWYLIGYGGDEELIRRQIAEAGMQQRVILLGKRDDPYPYIRACDLYVQPSRYEGKAVTVREAQLLGKPVAITAYATAASQLEDGVDGAIVPMDESGCAAGIAALLRDPDRMRRLAEGCAVRDYTGREQIAGFYALMED